MDATTWIVAAGSLVAAVVGPIAAGHALLTKRDPQVAAAWIAVSLMFPVAGPILYYIFGINRVRTRARKLFAAEQIHWGDGNHPTANPPDIAPEYAEQVRISDAVTGRALEGGNRVTPLTDGDEAFPAMLRAIEAAQDTVYLATYIFETNSSGQQFIDALAAARRRGLDVRVLIDGVGEFYSWPLAGRLLRAAGVPVARFLPPHLIPPQLSINLRNHRKILVIDGQTAFTGGMNLGDRHLRQIHPHGEGVSDMHFGFDGPVAAQIETVFLDDWAFSTGDHSGPAPRARPLADGALCRTITDGPNEDLDRLVMILVGAVSVARREIQIVTPYFLPPRPLTAALQAAALRGVQVDILLPEKNNLPFVHWATQHMLGELVRWGVNVHYQPPPFVHTKLFVVDQQYVQVGSANIDPRSLRLNFELAVEIYDRALASTLSRRCRERMARSRPVTSREMEGRPGWQRVRDALFWLASPYL